MTIYPLSGASWPAKQPAVEDAHSSHLRRREMASFPSSYRGFPRQWELRKTPASSFPVLESDGDGDYWSDASLSLPHLAAALPEMEEKESLPSLIACSENGDASLLPSAIACSENGDAHYQPRSLSHGPAAAKPIRDFPPPLDSPAHLLCEGRFYGLQSVEKVCFTSARSNGRLLVTAVPKPRLSLRAERRDGRLLIQLHVESSAKAGDREQPLAAVEEPAGRKELQEDDDGCSLPMEDGDGCCRLPMAACQAATAENSPSQEVDEASARASYGLFSEDDEGDQGREERENSLQTMALLQTLEEGDAASSESHRPFQIQCRSDRVTYKSSFISARPLHMLSIWQQTQALSLTEVLHPCLLKG